MMDKPVEDGAAPGAGCLAPAQFWTRRDKEVQYFPPATSKPILHSFSLKKPKELIGENCCCQADTRTLERDVIFLKDTVPETGSPTPAGPKASSGTEMRGLQSRGS